MRVTLIFKWGLFELFLIKWGLFESITVKKKGIPTVLLGVENKRPKLARAYYLVNLFTFITKVYFCNAFSLSLEYLRLIRISRINTCKFYILLLCSSALYFIYKGICARANFGQAAPRSMENTWIWRSFWDPGIVRFFVHIPLEGPGYRAYIASVVLGSRWDKGLAGLLV